jgi:hypothetical protein
MYDSKPLRRSEYVRNLIYTYLLHGTKSFLRSWSVFAASQEIPPIFYGTRKFFTVLTSTRHPSLSWANSIQSPRSPPTSWISILILSSHYVWVSPMASFPQVSPPTHCAPLPTLYICSLFYPTKTDSQVRSVLQFAVSRGPWVKWNDRKWKR